MYQFILLIHVFAAICIVALVLVQQGKGASVGAAFGSGASQTIFGSRGSGSFLFRLTISLITIFFITSLVLNYLTMHAYKKGTVITLPAVPTVPYKNNANKPANGVGAPADNTMSTEKTEQKTEEQKTDVAPVMPTEIPARN